MTTFEITAPRLSDAEHRVQLRRVVVAGTVGTIIEASDPLVGTLQAFGIYAVGFVARRSAPPSARYCRTCRAFS